MRFILFFVIVIGALIGAGFGVVALFDSTTFAQSGAVKREGMKTFRDAKLGLSFSYPDDWKEERLPFGMVRFTQEEDETPVMITQVSKQEVERSLAEYTKETMTEIAESSEQDGFTFILEESIETTLGGREAFRISAFMERDERVMRSVQIWSVAAGRVYSFTFSAQLTVFDNAVQMFENVLESVEIKD